MTLKELFESIQQDQQKGLERRTITLVAIAGENNRVKTNITDWLNEDWNGAYKLMAIPNKPENLIPMFVSVMSGDFTSADKFCKNSVFQVVYDATQDFMEAFSIYHTEKANFREIQLLAMRRVTRFEIKRIPVPSTSYCYLYVEVEGNVKITGECMSLDDDEKAMLLKEYGATQKGT